MKLQATLCEIFYHCTKFGAKMLIDAEIMAENLNPRWRTAAILDIDFGP